MKFLLKWMNDIKVRYKLMIIYVIIGFIPMSVMFFFSYKQIKNILKEKETESIESFLYEATVSMDNQMAIYNNLSNYVTFNQTVSQVLSFNYDSSYELYSQMSSLFDPMLSSLKYCHPDIKQLTIYVDKDVVRHDTTLAPLSEIVDKDWYEVVEDSKSNCWYVDNVNKKIFLISNMDTLEKNGIKGILYMELDYDKIFMSFSQAQRDNCGIFITNDDEQLIYSSDQFDDEFKKYQLGYAQLESVSKEEYMVVNDKSTEAGWNIWLYKPQELVIDSIEPIVKSAVLSLLLCIVATVIGLYSASIFITKRIESLSKNMREVDDGHMVIEVTSVAKDEIGSLIRNFGKMIKRIQVLIDEVYNSRLEQKNYEMRALQAQINPHFLYNSLSLINWKALEVGEEDISKITLALSSFYRTSLNKGKNTLSLGDEINNMTSYLKIQEIMHDYDFDIIVDIEEDMLEYESLNLILQPIVENAIEHGIDLKEDGRGYIKVIGWERKSIVYIMVEDNGNGMEQEKIDNILTMETKGYGVRNVNERIKIYYGQEYGLTVESTIGEGTKVTICFPMVKR